MRVSVKRGVYPLTYGSRGFYLYFVKTNKKECVEALFFRLFDGRLILSILLSSEDSHFCKWEMSELKFN